MLSTKPNVLPNPFYTYGSVDAISRAAPKLLVAQMARRKAARAGGGALDATLLDGGLHAHAIFRMPPLARAAGQGAHFATAVFF